MVAVGVGFKPSVNGSARGKFKEELGSMGGGDSGVGGVGGGILCCGGRVRLTNEVERRAETEFRRRTVGFE